MRTWKRIVSIIMTMLMIVTSIPFVIAESGEISGQCGDNATWRLIQSTGDLHIEGTGALWTDDERHAQWANYMQEIKTVKIDDGITNIPANAFFGAYKLESVQFPRTLKTIGSYAFFFCTSLQSADFPKGLESIGNCAFEGCTRMRDIVIPNSVQTIGELTFAICASLEEVVLPESLTTVEQGLFWQCYRLESVTIPMSVSTINGTGEPSAAGNISPFAHCFQLNEVINYSTTAVTASTVFHTLSLPADVDEETFLKYVIVTTEANGLQQLGILSADAAKAYTAERLEEQFGDDYQDVIQPMIDVQQPGEVGITSERPEELMVYCYPNSAEYEYCERNEIPYSLIINGQCGDNAFWNYDVAAKTMTISGKGEMWSYEVFEGLSCPWKYFEIETVHIEEGITSVGNSAFYDWGDYYDPHLLTEVFLPSTLETIDNFAFYDCQGLKSIHHSSPLKRIGAFAFVNCKALESFNFNDGLEFIGEGAFCGCSNLNTMIALPKSVKTIEFEAFVSCISVPGYEVDPDNTNFSSDENGCLYNKDQTVLIQYPAGNTRSSFMIPNTVKTISDEAFVNSTLTEVSIPEGVTDIGDHAFAYCKALKTVTIPKTVTSIGEKAIGFSWSEKYSDFTISGYIDTAAENYATANNIPFTLLYSGARVTGVSLNKTSVTIEKGKTASLTATIAPANAENKRVAWSSSDPNVATVDKNGVLTAKANGTATITVKTDDGGKTAACAVTVKTSVTGVTLNKTSADIVKGQSLQLTATINPNTASNKDKTWSSSNTNVATVSKTGLVTAKAVGSANITVKTNDGGKAATCKVTVKPAVVNVSSVSLDKTSLNLAIGMNETLSATIIPSNATNKNVKWSSSNAKVAKVDSSGKVTAVAEGTAAITAKTVDGSKTAKCTVTVAKKALSVIQYPSTEAINYYNGKAYSVYNGAKVDSIPVTIKINNLTDTKKTVYVKSSAESWFSLSKNSNDQSQADTFTIDGGSSRTISFQVYLLPDLDTMGFSRVFTLVTLDIYWDNVYNPANGKCSNESKHISVSPKILFKLPLFVSTKVLTQPGSDSSEMFSFCNTEDDFFKEGESQECLISKSGFSSVNWKYYLPLKSAGIFDSWGTSKYPDVEHSKWKGSCFGMTALLANLALKRIPVSAFGETLISKLKSPAKNTLIRDAINIVHKAQGISPLSEHMHSQSEGGAIKKLWDSLHNKTGITGIFPVVNLKGDGIFTDRHTVMAYNIIDCKTYYLVSIIDPNAYFPRSLKLKHDLSGLYEKFDVYSHIASVITDLSLVDINTYAPKLLDSGKKLSVKKADVSDDELPNTDFQNYTTISLQNFKEVTITNSKNETLTINYENETVTGDLEATIDTAIGSGEDPIVEVIIQEKEGAPEIYQITSSSDYILSVNHDQVIGQVKVNGSEASCVTYSPRGLIKVEKDEGSEYEMSLYAYDMAGDVCHVGLSGESATEASIENCDSGILLSSDDLENETVSVDHYDDELSEDYVSSLAGANVNEVLLTTGTDNTTELYINCDENPDHETKLNAHIYKKTIVEPTCTENGYYKYSCSSCEDEYREEIPMLGHTPDEPVVENEVLSTCTSDGSYDAVVRCVDCGEVLNRETIILEASGHTPGDLMIENAVEPTCDRKESHDEVEYCVECGTELSRVTVSSAPLGHIDEDNDGLCDGCDKQMKGDGRCKYCGQIHKGFGGFFIKILHFFLGLFGRTAHEVVS